MEFPCGVLETESWKSVEMVQNVSIHDYDREFPLHWLPARRFLPAHYLHFTAYTLQVPCISCLRRNWKIVQPRMVRFKSFFKDFTCTIKRYTSTTLLSKVALSRYTSCQMSYPVQKVSFRKIGLLPIACHSHSHMTAKGEIVSNFIAAI